MTDPFEEGLTRRRAWAEHPLSAAINVSLALLVLFVLCLTPMDGLSAWPWVVAGAWGVANAAAVGLVARGLTVPVTAAPADEEEGIVAGTSLWRDAVERLKQNQFATLSLGLVIVLASLCFGQAWIFTRWNVPGQADESFLALHWDHTRINKEETYAPPSARHWFGTDALGRDLFARTLYGGRISFLVSLVGTAVALIVGVAWGAVAGYFGGRIDQYLMRLVDVLYGLPFMFLVILILALVNGLQATASQNRGAVEQVRELERDGMKDEAAALAADKGITREIRTAVFLADNVKPIYVMFFALGLVSWLTMAQITRGQVLSLKEREFVVAARTIGAGSFRIIFRHIVPNLLGPVIVYTSLTVPSVMLSEAFLSFLGLGVSEPECSWGSLASQGLAGINVVKPFWWLVVYPAAAMSIALFSLNFIGDGLRDALDPRGRR